MVTGWQTLGECGGLQTAGRGLRAGETERGLWQGQSAQGRGGTRPIAGRRKRKGRGTGRGVWLDRWIYQSVPIRRGRAVGRQSTRC